MHTVVETDVLIVGSGPAGATAALALSTYGVPHIVVTRYASLADTPRAHITNQRTMEVLRDLGVEADVVAQATPQHLMGNTTFCTSLAGEELGRVRSWGNDPLVQAAHELASPTRMCDMPQHLMEPVLVDAAITRGTQLRFQTEYLTHTQDAGGVTATVRDRLRGDTYEIRARYLIGADGGRSKVAEDAGLPMGGQMGVAGSINIVFDADLTKYTAHRPSTLYWVLAPGATVGGIGAGLVRNVRPWNEWMIVWGYDVSAGAPDLTTEYAEEVVRRLVGDDDIPVTIKSSSAWTVNEMYAETYANGRVFCAGDAVHRHPPSNGLGSNTSVQDAYNLAWKLKLVLDGVAAPGLLDSYTAERAPVGKQIVTRANKSIAETAPVFEALDGLSRRPPTSCGPTSPPARTPPRPPRSSAPGCARRSPPRCTSSTPTESTSTSATSPPRSSPTVPPTPVSPATPSCTTSPPPAPARGSRTPGSPPAPAPCPPSTPWAGAASPSSPASAATPGCARRRPSPSTSPRSSSAPARSTRTRTATGPASARCPTRAHSSYARTGSSPSDTPKRPRTPNSCSRTRCGRSSDMPDGTVRGARQ